MTDLKKLCLELDDIVVQFFQAFDDTRRKQTELESLMKDGFINMAKARYNMGQRSVGALQYHEEDLNEAFTHMKVAQTDNGTEFAVEEGKVANPNTDGMGPGQTGLRKRNVNEKSSTSEQETVSAVDGKESEKDSDSDEKCKPSKDPIKWFGVLVPQTLRQSQNRFKECIPLICELATLQSRLLALKAKYRKLHKQKDEILGDVSDFEPRPMSLSMSSVSSVSSAEDLTEELMTKLNNTEE